MITCPWEFGLVADTKQGQTSQLGHREAFSHNLLSEVRVVPFRRVVGTEMKTARTNVGLAFRLTRYLHENHLNTAQNEYDIRLLDRFVYGIV